VFGEEKPEIFVSLVRISKISKKKEVRNDK
jgi:hypothetical protein